MKCLDFLTKFLTPAAFQPRREVSQQLFKQGVDLGPIVLCHLQRLRLCLHGSQLPFERLQEFLLRLAISRI
jgi:hypothetical protein